MKVQVFDMRDAPEPRDRHMVLRLVLDTGLQFCEGRIYTASEDTARNAGEIIAAAFGTELQWVGPSAVVAAVGTRGLTPPGSPEDTRGLTPPGSPDTARRWCPGCKASTQQERLSRVSWMCFACGRVLAEQAATSTPVVAAQVKPARPKQDGLNQLALF